KHLQRLLKAQSFQSENNYPPLFEHVYSFLKEQGVNERVAEDIVQHMMDKRQANNLTKEEVKERLKEAIEALLDTPSTNISPKKQIVQFVGPTGVGKTTTLAKVAALSMLDQEKKVAFITADTYRIAAIEQLKTYARI